MQLCMSLIVYVGQNFVYTTHGWTLLGAVIEKVSGEMLLRYMKKNVLDPLGMTATRAEFHTPLVYNRSR